MVFVPEGKMAFHFVTNEMRIVAFNSPLSEVLATATTVMGEDWYSACLSTRWGRFSYLSLKPGTRCHSQQLKTLLISI